MMRPPPLSKTRRKQESHALQDLGAELVALPSERLAEIELPDFLRDAVTAARRMSGFEAQRRQMQYIGKLMRKVDAEPIRARLEAWKSPEREQVARFKRIEAWRERLVLEAHALEEFRRQYPAVDEGELAALIDEARRERQENRPPKAYRRLFQKLRELT
jgi:ribosome-associated protein